MQKKILIFSTAYLPLIGGAEIAIKEITDRAETVQFDMITARLDRKLPKREKIGRINVYRIGIGWPLFDKYFLAFYGHKFAEKLNQENKYNLIWAIMASYGGFAAMFFKKSNPAMPFLLTLQEGDPIKEIKKKVFLVYPWFRKIFTKADSVTVISNYLANFAREMGYRGEPTIVPNGVDLNKFKVESSKLKIGELKHKLGIKDDEKIIITVSRLVKKNGVGDIIDAMKYLPENVKLLIIGTGELEQNLKSKIFNSKLGGRVIMLGQINNEIVPQYLAIADVFVRPSLSEGQGIAFLEAMAAGVPVIATPVGGIVDFLRDGETGWFCEVKNSHSIAEKIKYVFDENNKEKIWKVAENAKKMAEREFDWEIIALKMRNIFFKLTN